MRRSFFVNLIIISLVVTCCTTFYKNTAPTPLTRAHAHNDYDHKQPLFDALAHGFTNIEADAILKHDTLFVAHDPDDIVSARTLQSLYLDPLYALYQKNDGRIYPGWPTVYLMIDFKSDADSSYNILRPLLNQYADMLTRWRGDQKDMGAVTIIISGNRPLAQAAKESMRFIGIDGRADDFNNNCSPLLHPWISDDWSNHFEWRGLGEFPAAEEKKLAHLVERAHANGQMIRFWATDVFYKPAQFAIWNVLYEAGVDLINTDDLAGLREFLKQRGS